MRLETRGRSDTGRELPRVAIPDASSQRTVGTVAGALPGGRRPAGAMASAVRAARRYVNSLARAAWRESRPNIRLRTGAEDL